MPTIFRVGGGGTPQWNVYTGLTAPPVKENGLWVALDINIHNVNLVFGTSRPENPADKTLYIAYTSKDNMPLAKPLRNVDEISYHIVSAIWYTTAGGWTGVDLYVVKNGAWVLHNKGEYFLYVMSAGRSISKITEAGEIVWTTTIPSAYTGTGAIIRDAAVDNINGVIYVLMSLPAYQTGVNDLKFKLSKLEVSSGAVISSFPSGDELYNLGSISTCMGRVFLTPDRNDVIVTPGAGERSGITVKIGADLSGIKNRSTDDTFVLSGPNMRGNGKIRGINYASDSDYIAEIDVNTWSARNLMETESISQYFCYTLTTGESIFGYPKPTSSMRLYLNNGSKITHKWGDLIEGCTQARVGAILELIDGTLAFALDSGAFTGLWFARLNKVTGGLEEIGRTPYNISVYNAVITPTGTIYCASAEMVYRVNMDGTVAAIAETMRTMDFIYDRSFLVCDPCDRLTFPEYFS